MKYLIIAGSALGAVLLLIVICLVIQAIKKRSEESEHGPLLKGNE